MFKKLLDFFKNLFKPSTKKYEGENPYKYDYNTTPQDETWKDKQDKKIAELEKQLNDLKRQPLPSSPSNRRPMDPVFNIDFSSFMEIIDLLMGRGFVELGKGNYVLRGPNYVIEVSLMDRKITKTMGLTVVSNVFETGHDGAVKVESFLKKHMI
jgi:negative regulator of genetic competence, sporulation and motility